MFDFVRETTNNSGQQNPSSSILMYVLMGVLILGFIGFFIWSNYNNKKQQRKHTERLRGLEAGTRLITRVCISGIVESVNLEEGTFILKTGVEPNVTFLTFVLEAIYLSGPDADKAANQVAARIAPQSSPVQEVKADENQNNPPLQ